MNEFTNIEVHGKIYNVKDATARNKINENYEHFNDEISNINHKIDGLPGWNVLVVGETLDFSKE